MSSFDLSGRMTIGNVVCRLGFMFACVCVWEIRGMAVEAAVKPKALEIAYGPFVDWVNRTTVTISWEVDEAMNGRVRWSVPGGKPVEFSDEQEGERHLVTVQGISLDDEYTYRIIGINGGKDAQSKQYKFDSSFYYRLPGVAHGQAASRKESKLSVATDQILELANARAGYCLVLGGVDGSLALELIRKSDLQVVVVEQDAARVQQIRATLDEAGVYGVRASVLEGSL
ncbi:MAG: fibronectin type III domain-containing protein, partial [Verrucomicrobiia bacterium]